MSTFTMGNLFEGMRLLTALNLKEDIKKITLAKSEDGSRDVASIGYEVIFTVLEKASQKRCEQQIYDFLSKILNTEVNAESNPDEVVSLMETFADFEEWKGFFTRVWSMITRN